MEKRLLLTIDVEEWYSSSWFDVNKITTNPPHFCGEELNSMLKLLEQLDITATFFITAEIAEGSTCLIEKIHESDSIKKLMDEDHFYIWDEMTALFFNDSSLFSFSPSKNNEKVMVLEKIDKKGIEKAYMQSLGFPGDFHLSPRNSVVFTDIPRNPSLFREDIRPIVTSLIDIYGIEEWKACLLTNEFHRHLGIYSLVGAKMGIYFIAKIKIFYIGQISGKFL